MNTSQPEENVIGEKTGTIEFGDENAKINPKQETYDSEDEVEISIHSGKKPKRDSNEEFLTEKYDSNDEETNETVEAGVGQKPIMD